MRISRHPDRLTVQQSRTQLTMLLAGCRDEKLAEMTPEGLAGTHRISIAEAEQALLRARQGRRHE